MPRTRTVYEPRTPITPTNAIKMLHQRAIWNAIDNEQEYPAAVDAMDHARDVLAAAIEALEECKQFTAVVMEHGNHSTYGMAVNTAETIDALLE